jgi:hypothetical protein
MTTSRLLARRGRFNSQTRSASIARRGPSRTEIERSERRTPLRSAARRRHMMQKVEMPVLVTRPSTADLRFPAHAHSETL